VITYNLPEISDVKLEIFNILGQRVTVLAAGIQSSGLQKASWNAHGTSVSSGLYLCRITAGGKQSGKKYEDTIKMLMVK